MFGIRRPFSVVSSVQNDGEREEEMSEPILDERIVVSKETKIRLHQILLEMDGVTYEDALVFLLSFYEASMRQAEKELKARRRKK